MRKICIHLENEPIMICHGPFEAINIGCAKPELPNTFFDEKLTRKFGLKGFNDARGAVR